MGHGIAIVSAARAILSHCCATYGEMDLVVRLILAVVRECVRPVLLAGFEVMIRSRVQDHMKDLGLITLVL